MLNGMQSLESSGTAPAWIALLFPRLGYGLQCLLLYLLLFMCWFSILDKTICFFALCLMLRIIFLNSKLRGLQMKRHLLNMKQEDFVTLLLGKWKDLNISVTYSCFSGLAIVYNSWVLVLITDNASISVLHSYIFKLFLQSVKSI